MAALIFRSPDGTLLWLSEIGLFMLDGGDWLAPRALNYSADIRDYPQAKPIGEEEIEELIVKGVFPRKEPYADMKGRPQVEKDSLYLAIENEDYSDCNLLRALRSANEKKV